MQPPTQQLASSWSPHSHLSCWRASTSRGDSNKQLRCWQNIRKESLPLCGSTHCCTLWPVGTLPKEEEIGTNGRSKTTPRRWPRCNSFLPEYKSRSLRSPHRQDRDILCSTRWWIPDEVSAQCWAPGRRLGCLRRWAWRSRVSGRLLKQRTTGKSVPNLCFETNNVFHSLFFIISGFPSPIPFFVLDCHCSWISLMKWQWTGHESKATMTDKSHRGQEKGKISQGWPRTKWKDEIERYTGPKDWSRGWILMTRGYHNPAVGERLKSKLTRPGCKM